MDASLQQHSQQVFLENAQGVVIPIRAFGDNHASCPVLAMHGLQSHSGWFVQFGHWLSEQGFPTYLVDRRGSGLSEQPRGDATSYQEMVDDLQCVADWARERHSWDQVHIVGHCFGAIPATIYACQHPQIVKSLILPTPGIHTRSDLSWWHKLQIVMSQLSRRKRLIPVPLITEQFTNLEEYQDFIRHDKLSLSHATSSLYWQIAMARRYIGRHLAQLKMPVLVALAEHDSICDNRKSQQFFRRLPSREKKLLRYAEAVHILEFSPAKDAFFRDVAAWLQENTRNGGS